MENETFEMYLQARYPDTTCKSYSYSISKFKSENPLAADFNYQEIIDYLFDLKKAGLSVAYRTKILASLKKYYDFLRITSYRSDHPCKRMLINDYGLKGVHFDDLFTTDELQLLMEREERYSILEMKNKLIFSLLIYQGLTSQEIVNLTLNDVDLDQGIVSIKASRKLTARKLELHRTQFMILSRYIDEIRPKLLRQETISLVITKLGNTVTVDDVHGLLSSMKLLFPNKKLNPQKVRISVIANWLNIQKIPLSDVQLLAGHKWPSTTEKYLRTDLIEKRKLINQFHPLEQMDLIMK